MIFLLRQQEVPLLGLKIKRLRLQKETFVLHSAPMLLSPHLSFGFYAGSYFLFALLNHGSSSGEASAAPKMPCWLDSSSWFQSVGGTPERRGETKVGVFIRPTPFLFCVLRSNSGATAHCSNQVESNKIKSTGPQLHWPRCKSSRTCGSYIG